MKKIRLLLVASDARVRSDLRLLVQGQADILIAAEAEGGPLAAMRARECQPDVVVVERTTPGAAGSEAIREIKGACPQAAVLALTPDNHEKCLSEMLEAGVAGYIPSSAAPEALAAAVRTVYRGGVVLHPSLARGLLSDYLQKPRDNGPASGARPLTTREHEVLTLITLGLQNREIAEALTISAKTASRHRKNIMRKLNWRDEMELGRHGSDDGLILRDRLTAW